MARKVMVFQHNPWEGPGQFLLSAAEAQNLKLDIIHVWENKIPEIKNGHIALIVLGGGPNVDQEHIYPFLTVEKKS
jgi:hypothetical protein